MFGLDTIKSVLDSISSFKNLNNSDKEIDLKLKHLASIEKSINILSALDKETESYARVKWQIEEDVKKYFPTLEELAHNKEEGEEHSYNLLGCWIGIIWIITWPWAIFIIVSNSQKPGPISVTVLILAGLSTLISVLLMKRDKKEKMTTPNGDDVSK